VRSSKRASIKAFANPIFGMQRPADRLGARALGADAQGGRTARAMLIAAAADIWKADAADCRTSGRGDPQRAAKSFSYGQLAEKSGEAYAAERTGSNQGPTQFSLLGKSGTKRLDTVAKSTGKGQIGMDVYLPACPHPVIAYPPVPGGKVASVNDAKAKAVGSRPCAV